MGNLLNPGQRDSQTHAVQNMASLKTRPKCGRVIFIFSSINYICFLLAWGWTGSKVFHKRVVYLEEGQVTLLLSIATNKAIFKSILKLSFPLIISFSCSLITRLGTYFLFIPLQLYTSLILCVGNLFSLPFLCRQWHLTLRGSQHSELQLKSMQPGGDQYL